MENNNKSNMYGSFASVYDTFMDNVPYKEWCEYVTELLGEYEIEEGLILELGCGTGSLTELFSKKGYDMIGVDSSEDMLEIAMDKKAVSQSNILYVCQDMRSFELFGTVRAVVCLCDSMNYILEEDELVDVFALVNNYLDPGGLFIFDLNTPYKYRELMGNSTIAENRDNGSFIWENYFDEQEQINEYDLTLFIPETFQGKTGIYRKYEETHFQKAYELETIQTLLKRAGLEYITAYDALSHNHPKAESERIHVIAREAGKNSK